MFSEDLMRPNLRVCASFSLYSEELHDLIIVVKYYPGDQVE
jgi:hypothetical protein